MMAVQAWQIREHMSVVGSDGMHVGTVDRVEGERIKLTKRDDPDGSGQHHHYIPLSKVRMVEGSQVRLEMPAMATGSGVMGSATELAGKAQQAAGEVFDQARSRVESAARQAGTMAEDAYGQANAAARQAGDQLGRAVEQQPMLALLVAGAIGFTLGMIAASTRR